MLLRSSKINLKNRKIFALKMMGEHSLNSRFPLKSKKGRDSSRPFCYYNKLTIFAKANTVENEKESIITFLLWWRNGYWF